MTNPELVTIIKQNTGKTEPLSIEVVVGEFANLQPTINEATDELVAGQTLTVWTKDVEEKFYSMSNSQMLLLMIKTAVDEAWEGDGWDMQLQAHKF